MKNGVNIGTNMPISPADLCGQRVLGMNGSLTNWINTGSTNTINTSNQKDSFNSVPSSQKKQNSGFVKGIIVALAGVSAFSLLSKGKGINFSKISEYFVDLTSKVKNTKVVQEASDAAKDAGEKIKKTKSEFKFPKFQLPAFDWKISKKNSNISKNNTPKKQGSILDFFVKTFKKKKVSNPVNKTPKKKAQKQKKSFKQFISNIISKFSFNKRNKTNSVNLNVGNNKNYSGNPKVRTGIQTKAQRLASESPVDEVIEITNKPLFSGNPNVRKNTTTKAQKLLNASQETFENMVFDSGEISQQVLYTGNPKARKKMQDLNRFNVEDIIEEFSDKPKVMYSGKVSDRLNIPTKAHRLAQENTVQDVEQIANKTLYSGNPKTRRNTVSKAQKMQNEAQNTFVEEFDIADKTEKVLYTGNPKARKKIQDLDRFNVEDIIEEFSDKPKVMYSGKVLQRKKATSKLDKPKEYVEVLAWKKGDKFELIDGIEGKPIIARYEIDSEGKPVPYAIAQDAKPDLILSDSQKEAIRKRNEIAIRNRRLDFENALNFNQDEIQSGLNILKRFNYPCIEIDEFNNFDRTFVVDINIVKQLEKLGFPFNIKPENILEIANIDNIKPGEFYQFKYDPNPRFKLGKYSIDQSKLREFVGITKKENGNLYFVYGR